MSAISEQNQRIHCSICSNRLDRVKSWIAVQKKNLIVKLNVAINCSDKAVEHPSKIHLLNNKS